MTDIDQSRFNNQPIWIDAARAVAILEVKRATLYAYVSRGQVRSKPSTDQRRRRRLYHREDIERLVVRRNARRGHGAVAGGALLWGEPVLETAISMVGPARLLYRGHAAVKLATERTFEEVTELLWTGTFPSSDWHTNWKFPTSRRLKAKGPGRSRLLSMRAGVIKRALAADELGVVGQQAEMERMRSLVCWLAPTVSEQSVTSGESVAAMIVGQRSRKRAKAVAAVNSALVLTAEHGLNASTFAARIVASTGADSYACISAALAALSGPRHGGACDRVEALLRGCKTTASARQVIAEHHRLGMEVAGFGHPLYPDGDPRVPPLLEAARQVASASRLRALDNLLAAADRAKLDPPTLDCGLVAVTRALSMSDGAAAALFAVARVAGWAAHIFEQRRSGRLLRPTARFEPAPK